MSVRSLELKYFFTSNCFSSSKICRPVNVVRAFFFRLEISCDESSDESSPPRSGPATFDKSVRLPPDTCGCCVADAREHSNAGILVSFTDDWLSSRCPALLAPPTPLFPVWYDDSDDVSTENLRFGRNELRAEGSKIVF